MSAEAFPKYFDCLKFASIPLKRPSRQRGEDESKEESKQANKIALYFRLE